MKTVIYFLLLLAMILTGARATSSADTYSGQAPSCLPVPSPLDMYDSYYTDWGEEHRPEGYTLVAPPYWFDSYLMKNLFLYPKFDDYENRVDLYRQAFIVAILQGELTRCLNNDAQGRRRLQQLVGDIREGTSLSSEALAFANAVVGAQKTYTLDPSTIETATNEIAQHAELQSLNQSLTTLGTSLSTLSAGINIASAALQDTYLHTLVTADTYERIENLDEWMSRHPPEDGAIKEGYDSARAEVIYYAENDPDLLKEALEEADLSIGTVLQVGDLALSWGKVIAGSALSGAVANVAGGFITVGSAVNDLYAQDITSYQLLCAEAVVHSWLREIIHSYDWHNPPAQSCPEYRRAYYQAQMMRMGLAYSSYQLHHDMFAFRWNWTGVGKRLSEIVTFRYDDVADLQRHLRSLMSVIDTDARHLQEHFPLGTNVLTRITNHFSVGDNPPTVTIEFNESMEIAAFSPDCMSVVGSSSGSHSPMKRGGPGLLDSLAA